METKRTDHIIVDDFEGKVVSSPVPVLVYFYRELCHGCQKMASTIDELAKIYKQEKNGIQVFKCDDPELMRKCKVFFVPQIVLFVNGKDYWIERAIQTREGLQNEINRILGTVEKA